MLTKYSVETTKLVRVHHLRWVPELALPVFNFAHQPHARRPTVFDNPDLFATTGQIQPKDLPHVEMT